MYASNSLSLSSPASPRSSSSALGPRDAEIFAKMIPARVALAQSSVSARRAKTICYVPHVCECGAAHLPEPQSIGIPGSDWKPLQYMDILSQCRIPISKAREEGLDPVEGITDFTEKAKRPNRRSRQTHRSRLWINCTCHITIRSDAFKVSEFGYEIDVKLRFIRQAESRIRFDGSVALPQSHTTNKVSSATKHPLPGSRSKILVLFPRLSKTLGRGVLLEGTFA